MPVGYNERGEAIHMSVDQACAFQAVQNAYADSDPNADAMYSAYLVDYHAGAVGDPDVYEAVMKPKDRAGKFRTLISKKFSGADDDAIATSEVLFLIREGLKSGEKSVGKAIRQAARTAGIDVNDMGSLTQKQVERFLQLAKTDDIARIKTTKSVPDGLDPWGRPQYKSVPRSLEEIEGEYQSNLNYNSNLFAGTPEKHSGNVVSLLRSAKTTDDNPRHSVTEADTGEWDNRSPSGKGITPSKNTPSTGRNRAKVHIFRKLFGG